MNKESKLLIPDTADLSEAMAAIRANARGMIFIHDAKERVVGMLTDGDISNVLLKHGNMHDPVTERMNTDFMWVPAGTTKEQTLKLLDVRIRAIPVLDSQRRLVALVSTGYMEPRPDVYARAKAPIRVSFSGGGTDFTNYFTEHGGVSLSATVGLHSRAVLRKRADRGIQLNSGDTDEPCTYEGLHELVYDGRMDLIKAGIKVMKPEFGFDLWVGSDFPLSSGLGGSASVLAAVIGCLNEFREDPLDSYAIAEHAFEAERIELGIKGGWQDQYSTVFGGFNFINFDAHTNTVTPLRLSEVTISELEERSLICYTGHTHRGHAIQEQNHSRDPNDPAVLAFANEIKSIANTMKSRLVRGNLSDFGRLLDKTWQLKISQNQQVTDDGINRIYASAIEAGAEGGRLLGTGGGGYFLFFLQPFRRWEVAEKLTSMGLATQSVLFDDRGLRSWISR